MPIDSLETYGINYICRIGDVVIQGSVNKLVNKAVVASVVTDIILRLSWIQL